MHIAAEAGEWYDFVAFDVGDGEPSEYNLRAFLYRAGNRVIGFASVMDTTTTQWHAFDSQDEGQSSAGTTRPAVNVIFTADVWRRRGIARELVEAVARLYGIAVTEIAWSGPFSKTGLALAKSISPAGVWMV
jgi:GNAT superfamily N-acetyltransferase